jgi:hypothetical protein
MSIRGSQDISVQLPIQRLFTMPLAKQMLDFSKHVSQACSAAESSVKAYFILHSRSGFRSNVVGEIPELREATWLIQ